MLQDVIATVVGFRDRGECGPWSSAAMFRHGYRLIVRRGYRHPGYHPVWCFRVYGIYTTSMILQVARREPELP